MKSNFLILLLLFVCSLQHMDAQNRPTDKVFLKDQTVVEGIVIEQKPGEYISILRWPDRDTLQIAFEDIDRMNRIIYEEESVQNQLVEEKQTKEQNQNWWRYESFNSSMVYGMVHYLQGGGDYSFQGFGLSFGLNITPGFQVGASSYYVGQLSSTGIMPDRQTIPLALDIRQTLTRSKSGRFTTMLALSGGYSFTLNGHYFDEAYQDHVNIGNGYYFNPAIVFRANILKNAGLMFDLGYHYNDATFQYRDSGDKISTLKWHNFMLKGTLFF